MFSIGTKITPELIHAAQQGKLRALNLLIMECQDRIYNLVLQLVQSSQDSERLTQKVFLLLSKELSGFRGGDFNVWLLKIVVKVCRPVMKPKPNGVWVEAMPSDYLSDLRADLRLVVVLVDFAGLDYDQAAKVLGISKRKVQSRLAQARYQISISLVQQVKQVYV